MAGMRPSCTPDVQAALRETRCIEWNKRLNFNASIILTDEEVRQLTEAGWVETDKNAHLRRDNDYVSIPAKYKSRLVDCGNFKTTERFRTDSAAGDVDSHNIVCSHHSCDFTHGYFQGLEIDRILHTWRGKEQTQLPINLQQPMWTFSHLVSPPKLAKSAWHECGHVQFW